MRKRIYNKLAVLAISGIVALSSNSLWAMGASSYPEKSLNKEVVTQNSELSKKEKLEIDVKGKTITEEREVTEEEVVNQLHNTELNALYLLDTSSSRDRLIKQTYEQTDEWMSSMKKMNVTRYAWDFTNHYEQQVKPNWGLKPVEKVIESTLKKDLAIIKLVNAMKENMVANKPNFFIYESDMEDQIFSEDLAMPGGIFWNDANREKVIDLLKRIINDVYNETGAKSILMVDKANEMLGNNLPIVKNNSGKVIGTVIDSLDDREAALNKAFASTVKTSKTIKTEKTVYPKYTFKVENTNGEDLTNEISAKFNNQEVDINKEFTPSEAGKLNLEINSTAKQLKEKEQVLKVSVLADGKLVAEKVITFRAKKVIPAGMIEDNATKVTKKEVEIPFETERKENPELPKGEERVVVKGENGKKLVTTVQVGSQEPKVTEEVIKKPVNQVIEVGTKIVKPWKPVEDIATKTTKKEVEIPFETERKENPELPKGEERVVVKGENGKKLVTTVQVGSQEPKVTEEVIKKPVNQVIEVGTKIVKPWKPVEDIATKTTKKEVEIPFETERKENSELPKGEERVVVKGENGKKIVTTVTVGEKGEPKVTEEVIKKPVNEVIEVGTKVVEPTKVVSTGSQSVEVIAGALLSLSMLSFLGIRRKSRNKQN